jgi:hypothetical protein
MAASMIAAFIAVVAVSTLKTVSLSAATVEGDIEVADGLRFAIEMVRRDLLNFYRDGSDDHGKFVGSLAGDGDNLSSMITFYTTGRTKARVNEPEGDVYEVEYFILQSEEKSAFVRRVWPNPDNLLPVGFEQRGVLTIIADDIAAFQVRYFDGEMWQIDWPEELTELPELVEVSMASATKDGRTAAGSFTVNFVRAGGGLVSDIEEAEQGEAREQSDSEEQGDMRSSEQSSPSQSESGGGNRNQSSGQNQSGSGNQSGSSSESTNRNQNQGGSRDR